MPRAEQRQFMGRESEGGKQEALRVVEEVELSEEEVHAFGEQFAADTKMFADRVSLEDGERVFGEMQAAIRYMKACDKNFYAGMLQEPFDKKLPQHEYMAGLKDPRPAYWSTVADMRRAIEAEQEVRRRELDRETAEMVMDLLRILNQDYVACMKKKEEGMQFFRAEQERIPEMRRWMEDYEMGIGWELHRVADKHEVATRGLSRFLVQHGDTKTIDMLLEAVQEFEGGQAPYGPLPAQLVSTAAQIDWEYARSKFGDISTIRWDDEKYVSPQPKYPDLNKEVIGEIIILPEDFGRIDEESLERDGDVCRLTYEDVTVEVRNVDERAVSSVQLDVFGKVGFIAESGEILQYANLVALTPQSRFSGHKPVPDEELPKTFEAHELLPEYFVNTKDHDHDLVQAEVFLEKYQKSMRELAFFFGQDASDFKNVSLRNQFWLYRAVLNAKESETPGNDTGGDVGGMMQYVVGGVFDRPFSQSKFILVKRDAGKVFNLFAAVEWDKKLLREIVRAAVVRVPDRGSDAEAASFMRIMRKCAGALAALEDVSSVADSFFSQDARQVDVSVNTSVSEMAARVVKVTRELIHMLRPYTFSDELQDKEWLKRLTWEDRKEKIDEILDGMDEKVMMFASIFKAAMRENPNLRFEDIAHTEYYRVGAPDLTQEQRGDLLALARSSPANPAALEAIRKILDPMDESDEIYQKSRLSVVDRYNEKEKRMTPVAFLRSYMDGEGVLHVTSFIVNDNARDAGIGNVFVREEFLHALRERVREIEFAVTPENPAVRMYVGKLGAFGVGMDPDVRGTDFGLVQMRVTIPPPKYELRSLSSDKDEARQMLQDIAERQKEDPLSHVGEKHIVISVDPKKDVKKVVEIAETLLNSEDTPYHLVVCECVRKKGKVCVEQLFGFEKKET